MLSVGALGILSRPQILLPLTRAAQGGRWRWVGLSQMQMREAQQRGPVLHRCHTGQRPLAAWNRRARPRLLQAQKARRPSCPEARDTAFRHSLRRSGGEFGSGLASSSLFRPQARCHGRLHDAVQGQNNPACCIDVVQLDNPIQLCLLAKGKATMPARLVAVRPEESA